MTDVWWDGIPNWVAAIGTAVASGFAAVAYIRSRETAGKTEILKDELNDRSQETSLWTPQAFDERADADEEEVVPNVRWEISRRQNHIRLRNTGTRRAVVTALDRYFGPQSKVPFDVPFAWPVTVQAGSAITVPVPKKWTMLDRIEVSWTGDGRAHSAVLLV